MSDDRSVEWTSLRDVLVFHALFVLVALAVLVLLPGGAGRQLLALVLAYHIALVTLAKAVDRPDWLALWSFLLPLSVLQVLPDWYLASAAGVLEFPDTGAPAIGPVPVFMAGLWVVPLFPIVYTAQWVCHRRGAFPALASAAVLSSVIFTLSEATLWQIPVWRAVGVAQTAHVAHYLLIPELALGPLAWLAFRHSRSHGLIQRLGAAAAVMLAYLGSAILFLAWLG